jgi:hypothetical protein
VHPEFKSVPGVGTWKRKKKCHEHKREYH